MDIKDGVCYELSGNTGADYNVYSLVFHEREAELDKKRWINIMTKIKWQLILNTK